MDKKAYYLTVVFKKIDVSGDEKVYFKPEEVIFGQFDKNDFFVDMYGNKYPYIENYLDNEEFGYFYAFPTIIGYTSTELSAYSENEEKTSEIQNILKAMSCNKYFSTVSYKDEQQTVVICEQDVLDNARPCNVDKSLFEVYSVKNISVHSEEKISSRKEIIDFLKDRVISQDSQIESLVSSILSNQKYAGYEGLKENVMLIGSTGTGKTEMVSSLAKILKVPFAKVDANQYTKTGWKGDNIVNMLKSLYIAANNDVELAEKGIIFIDEFDKLGSNGSDSTIATKDVQRELLGIISGGDYKTNGDSDSSVTINTSKITFVFAGAFQHIIEEMSKNKKSIGFSLDKSQELKNKKVVISRKDLKEKGNMEPELLGRISKIIQLNTLDTEDLKKIMKTSSISNLRIWQTAFWESDKVKLTFTEESMDLIAQKAYNLNAGARGIQTIVTDCISQIRNDILDYKLSNCEVIIDSETVEEPTKYKVKKLEEKREKYEKL